MFRIGVTKDNTIRGVQPSTEHLMLNITARSEKYFEAET